MLHVHGLSLVAASRGYSLVVVHMVCRVQASVVVACGLSSCREGFHCSFFFFFKPESNFSAATEVKNIATEVKVDLWAEHLVCQVE